MYIFFWHPHRPITTLKIYNGARSCAHLLCVHLLHRDKQTNIWTEVTLLLVFPSVAQKKRTLNHFNEGFSHLQLFAAHEREKDCSERCPVLLGANEASWILAEWTCLEHCGPLLFSGILVCFRIYMRCLKINGYLPPSPFLILDQEVVLLFILNTSFLFHTSPFGSITRPIREHHL